MIRARFDILFEAGKLMVASRRLGAVSLYCFIDIYYDDVAKVRIKFGMTKKVGGKFGGFAKSVYLCTRIRQNKRRCQAKSVRDLAQLVAHTSGGREVAGSSPVIPTKEKG